MQTVLIYRLQGMPSQTEITQIQANTHVRWVMSEPSYDIPCRERVWLTLTSAWLYPDLAWLVFRQKLCDKQGNSYICAMAKGTECAPLTVCMASIKTISSNESLSKQAFLLSSIKGSSSCAYCYEKGWLQRYAEILHKPVSFGDWFVSIFILSIVLKCLMCWCVQKSV